MEETRMLGKLVGNWNRLSPEGRARVMHASALMVAKGQAVRASRALDQAMAAGGEIEPALGAAVSALRTVLEVDR